MDYGLFKRLEEASGRKEKERILKDSFTIIPGTFSLIKFALDPFKTFGIKKLTRREGEDGPGVHYGSFILVASKLAARELTGNAATAAVNDFKMSCTNEQWNDFFMRLLLKDLRCGVTITTINNILDELGADEFKIVTFGCQLAHDTKGGEFGLNGKKIIETKLDGVRVLTFIRSKDDIKMYSRNGRELTNFTHIINELKNIYPFKEGEEYVLDGEIMSASFRDLMTQVNRKHDVNAADAILNVFDLIPMQDFISGKCNVPQGVRIMILKHLIDCRFSTIVTLGGEIVDLDTPEGQNRLTEINSLAIAGGYEGIMLKDPLAPYECERSSAWLKMKPFIELTMEVIGVEEGSGKYKGTLGALICSCNEDGKDIIVNVGSGLKDSEREEMWSVKEDLIGSLVEIRADAITSNKSGGYSLRFPRFKMFRGFEQKEKM